ALRSMGRAFSSGRGATSGPACGGPARSPCRLVRRPSFRGPTGICRGPGSAAGGGAVGPGAAGGGPARRGPRAPPGPPRGGAGRGGWRQGGVAGDVLEADDQPGGVVDVHLLGAGLDVSGGVHVLGLSSARCGAGGGGPGRLAGAEPDLEQVGGQGLVVLLVHE